MGEIEPGIRCAFNIFNTTAVVLPHVSGCALVGVVVGGVAPWGVTQPEVATIRVLVDVDDKRCAARCRARVIVATCNTHTRVHH